MSGKGDDEPVDRETGLKQLVAMFKGMTAEQDEMLDPAKRQKRILVRR